MTSFLYSLSRFLQLVGLIVVPFGITGELAGKLTLANSLIVAGSGAAIFISGVLLQNLVKR